jgi:hypothetical protein
MAKLTAQSVRVLDKVLDLINSSPSRLGRLEDDILKVLHTQDDTVASEKDVRELLEEIQRDTNI